MIHDQKERQAALAARMSLPGEMPLFLYDVTDSTNARARAYAAAHGGEAVFLAGEQTAGRGRMDRTFLSAAGAGLYISYLFRPRGKGTEALKVTPAAAVAVCRVLERLAPSLDCRIKWVNDVYAAGKKICGILCEGTMDPAGEPMTVVGIGINLLHRDFPEDIPLAGTVEDAVGTRLDRDAVAAELTRALLPLLHGPVEPSVMQEYRRRSLLIGRDVTVFCGNENYPAQVLGIGDGGELLLRRPGGEQTALLSGEVSVRPVDGRFS